MAGLHDLGGGSGRVLVAVHQGQQLAMLEREAHVGAGERGEAGPGVGFRLLDRAFESGGEAQETGLRECVEQRLTVPEVLAGCGVTDPGLTSELPEGESVDTVLLERALGAREQHLAKTPVVVGLFGDGHAASLAKCCH